MDIAVGSKNMQAVIAKQKRGTSRVFYKPITKIYNMKEGESWKTNRCVNLQEKCVNLGHNASSLPVGADADLPPVLNQFWLFSNH
jgi:hypothetical protein